MSEKTTRIRLSNNFKVICTHPEDKQFKRISPLNGNLETICSKCGSVIASEFIPTPSDPCENCPSDISECRVCQYNKEEEEA